MSYLSCRAQLRGCGAGQLRGTARERGLPHERGDCVGWSALGRACGPAFVANSARNAVMSTTSFVATPLLFLHAFPQEHKSHSSLFWFGLSVNIFAGNVVAITQQSLWGRVLNYVEEGGGRNANYRAIIGEAYRKEGLSAFFTPPKWFARVLMNAPIQGTLPWFYNQVLPRGEKPFLAVLKPALGVFGYK